jgi:hypothetical protein
MRTKKIILTGMSSTREDINEYFFHKRISFMKLAKVSRF